MTSHPRTLFLLLPLLALFALEFGRAQSSDPAKPTPLAPGLNKGNVDNFSGSRYYTFIAGPGHVQVDMTFRQTNLSIGALRQVLHFNFYNADKNNKLVSAFNVESLDQTGHLTEPGDIPVRTHYIVEVKAADGFVKMGGYYELSVTGAVDFGDAKNSSSNVQPTQTFLVQPLK